MDKPENLVCIGVGLGELLDRVIILEVKRSRLPDDERRNLVDKDYCSLREKLLAFVQEAKVHDAEIEAKISQLEAEFLKLHSEAWDLTDEQLIHIARESYEELGRVARRMFDLNKRRILLKNEATRVMGSQGLEVKSYFSTTEILGKPNIASKFK